MKKKIIPSPSQFLIFLLFLSTTLLSCSSSTDEDIPNTTPETVEDTKNDESENDSPNSSLNPEQATSGVIRGISAMEFVKEMNIGWNLGNSMDVEARDKTQWGNPLPTTAMIEAIAKKGFTTLRIPVTWSYHQGNAPDYAIEASYLDAVQDIVDVALSQGMHVIINTHHEDPWVIPTNVSAVDVNPRLASLWTQVADRFKTYGDYLIFESLNEPRHEGTPEEWQGGTEEGRSMVNEYHKTCLDAIRATGENNTSRFVMISPYAAGSSDLAMNSLQIPNDDTNIIISIHSYFPFEFTLNEGGTSSWGSPTEKAQLESELERIKNKWIIGENRPVILGEWGTLFKNNNAVRSDYASSYVNGSLSRGMIPILWDNGSQNELGLLNRNSLTWNWHSDVIDAIIDASR